MVTNHVTPGDQLKNQNSQKFLLQKYVIWKCDTLAEILYVQNWRTCLIWILNFIFVMSPNGLFAHAQY